MDYKFWVSLAVSLIFGIISLVQWSQIRSFRVAIRTHGQYSYNAWWYVGAKVQRILDSDQGLNLAYVREQISEINGISHTARNEVIPFSRNYAGEIPKYEKAWEPNKE